LVLNSYIERDCQQIGVIAETFDDGLGIARRRDDAVALGERAFCNEGAKAARGAGDESGFHKELLELKDVRTGFTLAYL
jgi:hypothetical protein